MGITTLAKFRCLDCGGSKFKMIPEKRESFIILCRCGVKYIAYFAGEKIIYRKVS